MLPKRIVSEQVKSKFTDQKMDENFLTNLPPLALKNQFSNGMILAKVVNMYDYDADDSGFTAN